MPKESKESKEAKAENRKKSKKYLRAITKDTKHPIRHTRRIIKYGISNFGRNVSLSLSSVLIMTITLLILSVTVISNVILNETAASLRDKIDITIYIKPRVTTETLSSLSDILYTDQNIKRDSITTHTSEEEFNIFLEENSDNQELIDTLNDEEMKEVAIGTMQSTIRFKVNDPENLDSIKTLVETNETFIENIDPDKEPTYGDENKAQIEVIGSWARIAKNAGIILGAIFLVISFIVIFNTIRMAIFSRREEIYMMKLVGGTKSFIRGPFIVEASASGALSGIITATILYFGIEFLSPILENHGISLSTITQYLESSWLVVIYAALALLGILIGSTASRFAFQKYIHKL